MQVLDLTFSSPADNLACDELLLDLVETDTISGLLRFWESPRPFVVLGVSQCVHNEVNMEACHADDVPVLRRASAGGCVLQGPGSLNYTLALRRASHPALDGIRSSYCHLLGRACKALSTLGIQAEHAGISDLAIEGRKISGNAQKRRRNAILHHGTLLYRLRAEQMRRYLKEPADRPDYRGDRSHDDFLTQIPVTSEALRQALIQEFAPAVTEPFSLNPDMTASMRMLSTSKYGTDAWTHRR